MPHWWPEGDPPLDDLPIPPPETRNLRPAGPMSEWRPGIKVQVDGDKIRVHYPDQPPPLYTKKLFAGATAVGTTYGPLARQELWSKRDKTRSRSRTLSGAEALASLRPTHPEEARFPSATAADRLNQGPQPPHSTATSSATWYGSQSALADLGREPTLREISDSHAWVSGDGEGRHCHHFTSRDGVGPASTQACQQHLGTIHEGRSKVPREDLADTKAHLVRHLRDANAEVPRSIFEPVNPRAAQRRVEELLIADEIAARREYLVDLRDRDEYFAARDRMSRSEGSN